MLAGADNRHLPGIAHVHMAFHATVFGEVWRLLKGPAQDAPTVPAFRFKGEVEAFAPTSQNTRSDDSLSSAASSRSPATRW